MKFKFEFSKIRSYIPIIIMVITLLYKLYIKIIKKQETFIMAKDGTFISEGFKDTDNEKI